MNAAHYQSIVDQGGVVPFPGRTLLQLTGGDRVRYLNGQVTNDIRKVSAQAATYALVTDHKAHILADIFVHASADGSALLLDAEAHLRETLAARLERYIIADDVELTDVTEAFQLIHVFGPAADALQNHPGAIASERLGLPGIDLWLPVGTEIPSGSAPRLDEADFETLRILRGIPRHPAELNENAFPAEAGLEARGVSFSKGCYIGQEVISRIQSTGKMPRTLVKWTATDEGAKPISGMQLASPEEPEKTIGTITSTTTHPLTGLSCGLAYVKQGQTQPDSTLLARGEPPTLAAIVKINAVSA